MKKEQLKNIIGEIKSVKIAVLGDFCLDAYWFIDESKSEISIETGQMTRPIKQQRYSLGGAGNVTNNITAMGVQDVRAFGVIGPDPFGYEMVKVMKQNGINPKNLLVQEKDWSTHVYTKPYVGDTEQSRIDFGNFNKLSKHMADKLINNLVAEIPEVDIINAVISDVTLFETDVEFYLRIRNHTAEPLEVYGATYRITINDADIGEGLSSEHFVVERYSSAHQKVRITLSNFSVLHNIRLLVEAKRFNYSIEAEFDLNSTGFGRKAYSENSARFDFKNIDVDIRTQ